MKLTKANLVLHPVRLRIIQALMGARQLTPQQLAEALPDVPQATLYRHINKLAGADVLAVVAERRVRGALEKVYALPESGAHLTQADLANASGDDHMQFFTHFVATLLGDFARYLERGEIDMLADGVGYRQVALYLSDEEFRQMATALNQALAPFLQHQPAPSRQRRLLTTIVMPGSDSVSPEGEGATDEPL